MAKKINKKNKKAARPRTPRLTSARLTIQEGQDFVRRAARLSRTTRTMRSIVGVRITRPIVHAATVTRPKKTAAKPAGKTVKPIKTPKKTHQIKRVPAAPKKARNARRPPAAARVPVVTAAPAAAMARGTAAATVARSGSRLSKNSANKATKFQASARDDLQIPAFGFIDVCFCLDATGSMSGEIEQVKQVIQAIINNIENKVRTEGLQLRFAIVSYRDHPPQDSTYVTKIQDFTDNFEAINYVKTLQAAGGGDFPEAVHDGLFDSATKLRWAEVPGTPVLRYIFHVADAPPHGKEFVGEQNEGCLCGMQTDQVMHEINKRQIHYRLIKVRTNPQLEKMAEIFKSKLMDYDETDVQHASEMNVKVSEMIICEILPDFA